MTTVIRFENVSKRYNLGLTRTSLPSIVSGYIRNLTQQSDSEPDKILWALENVSFSLEEGESLALIGPNGAGKTTILKLLAHVTKPTSGHFVTRGKLSALIELGAGFHPDLTGRENIFLNGTILGLSRKDIEQRLDEIVDFAELDKFIDTPVKRYSSGMTVRLGFAVASCIDPAILLVDEVLAVGDAAFQQKCLKRIHSLKRNGTTIVFVSHNFYLVQAACSVALYLQKGNVKHFGTLRDAFDLYERDTQTQRTKRSAAPDQLRSDELAAIEITRVRVTGCSGSESELRSDLPALIKIHYQSRRALGRVHVSAFILRSDNVICCMIRTKLDAFHVSIEEGHGVITVSLDPLQLVGGAYYAEAWILDESDSIPITGQPARSDWFTVIGKALSVDEQSVFEPHTSWSHDQFDTPFGAESVTVNSEAVPVQTLSLSQRLG